MSRTGFWAQTRKKPTINRFFILLLMVTTAVTNTASAQQDEPTLIRVTESEAIELALDHEPRTRRWEQEIQERRADATVAGAFPNPSVGYHREQQFAGPTRWEETVALEQRLPISGRRRLQTRAAREMTRAQQAQIADEQSRLRRQIRELFYRLVYRQRVVEIHRQSVGRLDDTIDGMEQRVDAGESSPYELERLRREKAELEATVEIEIGRIQDERAEMANWLGIPLDTASSLRPRGQLLPDEVPAQQELAESVAAHPRLMAVGHRIDAYELEADAAARWWIPDLIIHGGFKRERLGPTQELGFEVGLSVAIPLFYRGGGHRDRARARSMQARANRQWNRESMIARTRGLIGLTNQLIDAAADYEQQSVDRARHILRLAEQSYDAGEAGLLELLDAHQGLLDARLRKLELSAEARNHLIELLNFIESEEK